MLRRHADKLLINGDYADLILNDDTGGAPGTRCLTLSDYGIICDTHLISGNKTCSADATAGEITVDVVIPESCECPYEWCLTIVCLPNLQLYNTYNTFPSSKVYCYEDPAGGTPTDTDTAAAIAAAINADPFACVEASVVGAQITLTSLDGATTGFQAYAASGTVTTVTEFIPPVLDTDEMARIFPIETGTFGSIPTLPVRGGDYCKYNIVIRGQEDVQDVDGANHWNAYEKEVDIYILDGGADPGYVALIAALDAIIA